ncbi:MAG: hypothetical protein ACPLLR_02645 [Methanothrix sp.]|nr:hypothetical protein [Methanothrix sp.]HPO87908.1 hypothetical protein [Methanothrix sp.]
MGRVITDQLDLKKECMPEVGASPGGVREEKRMGDSVQEIFMIMIVFRF